MTGVKEKGKNGVSVRTFLSLLSLLKYCATYYGSVYPWNNMSSRGIVLNQGWCSWRNRDT